MLKFLKIGLPILLIGGLVVFKFTQPKPPLNIHTAPTEITTDAVSLYAAFEEDETAANTANVGKVLEVSGILNAVEKSEAGDYVLHLNADSPLGQITCNLAPNETLNPGTTSINEPLTVKGVCTGYLFDVVIDNATLLSQ